MAFVEFILFLSLIFLLSTLINLLKKGKKNISKIFLNFYEVFIYILILISVIIVFCFKDILLCFLQNDFYTFILVLVLILISLPFLDLINLGFKFGKLLYRITKK